MVSLSRRCTGRKKNVWLSKKKLKRKENSVLLCRTVSQIINIISLTWAWEYVQAVDRCWRTKTTTNSWQWPFPDIIFQFQLYISVIGRIIFEISLVNDKLICQWQFSTKGLGRRPLEMNLFSSNVYQPFGRTLTKDYTQLFIHFIPVARFGLESTGSQPDQFVVDRTKKEAARRGLFNCKL